jgi:hypothetical protein
MNKLPIERHNGANRMNKRDPNPLTFLPPTTTVIGSEEEAVPDNNYYPVSFAPLR